MSRARRSTIWSALRANGGSIVCPALRRHVEAAVRRSAPFGASPIGLSEIGYLNYVLFPDHLYVSLLYVMEDGASAEIAIVGNEGLIGNFPGEGDNKPEF
jgi:hypothetical protein